MGSRAQQSSVSVRPSVRPSRSVHPSGPVRIRPHPFNPSAPVRPSTCVSIVCPWVPSRQFAFSSDGVRREQKDVLLLDFGMGFLIWLNLCWMCWLQVVTSDATQFLLGPKTVTGRFPEVDQEVVRCVMHTEHVLLIRLLIQSLIHCAGSVESVSKPSMSKLSVRKLRMSTLSICKLSKLSMSKAVSVSKLRKLSYA